MTNLVIIAAMLFTNTYQNPDIPVVRIGAKSIDFSRSTLTNQQLRVKLATVDGGVTNVLGWFAPR